MKKMFALVVLSVILAIAAGMLFADDTATLALSSRTDTSKVSLRLLVSKGDKFIEKNTYKRCAFGGLARCEVVSEIETESRVLEVDEKGNYLTKSKVVDNRFFEERDGKKITYDSKNPSKETDLAEILEFDPWVAPFTALQGTGCKCKIDNRGKELARDGCDENIDIIWKKIEKYVNDTLREELMAVLKTMYGDEDTLMSFSDPDIVYPENPISIGDSWTELKITNSIIGYIAVQTTYQFVSRENGEIVLKSKSSFLGIAKDNGGPGNSLYNAQAKNVDGEQNGTIVIDEKTGMIKSVESDAIVVADVEINGQTRSFTFKEETNSTTQQIR